MANEKWVKFSNGQKITANDVRNSWIQLLKTPGAPFASLFDIIVGAQDFRTAIENGLTADENIVAIKVKDELTLTVRLATPADYLPNILCHASFSVINPNKLVFSGPFTLTEKTKNSVRITKNPNYWDAENVRLPSVRFILSEDMEENTFLYNNGKIDWIIDGVHTSKILSFSDISISPQFGTEYFFFRPVRSPWNNAKLRSAMLSAIQWEKLQQDSIVKATSLLVPLPDYPEIFGVNEYDLDAAQDLLKDALEELQENSELQVSELISELISELPPVVIAVPDAEYQISLAQILSECWSVLGLRTQIMRVPLNSYFQSVQSLSADIFLYNWIGDFADPMAFLELFRGDSGLNVTGWNDSVFDNMLKEAASGKAESHFEKLSEAEQYMLDQGIVIPVSHTVALNILDKNTVRGWYENAMNIHPLKNIYIGKRKIPINVVCANDDTIEKK